MAGTRTFSWLTLVLQADPDHGRDKRYTKEYEFSAPGGGPARTHEEGLRVFKANYDQRGPYAPEED